MHKQVYVLATHFLMSQCVTSFPAYVLVKVQVSGI